MPQGGRAGTRPGDHTHTAWRGPSLGQSPTSPGSRGLWRGSSPGGSQTGGDCRPQTSFRSGTYPSSSLDGFSLWRESRCEATAQPGLTPPRAGPLTARSLDAAWPAGRWPQSPGLPPSARLPPSQRALASCRTAPVPGGASAAQRLRGQAPWMCREVGAHLPEKPGKALTEVTHGGEHHLAWGGPKLSLQGSSLGWELGGQSGRRRLGLRTPVGRRALGSAHS